MKPNPAKTARWCAISSFAFGMVCVAIEKTEVANLLFVVWAIFAAASLIIDAMEEGK